MINKVAICSEQAPKAIGTYSQAIKVSDTVYLSGQIPLDPKTMELVAGPIDLHIRQAFKNLIAVCSASGGTPPNIVKLNVFLTDLAHFDLVNKVMSEFFSDPYPARAAIEVKALPRGAIIEIDGIMVI